MKRFAGLFVGLSLMIYSCATAAATPPVPTFESVPLPQQIQIIPPDPNLPPEIKALSGKWGGRWWNPRSDIKEGFDAILIVEEIVNGRQAKIIYAWGDCKEWKSVRNWTRVEVNITTQNKTGEAILFFTSPRGLKYEFSLEKDGNELTGICTGIGHGGHDFINRIVMKRIP